MFIKGFWIPAYAGMTSEGGFSDPFSLRALTLFLLFSNSFAIASPLSPSPAARIARVAAEEYRVTAWAFGAGIGPGMAHEGEAAGAANAPAAGAWPGMLDVSRKKAGAPFWRLIGICRIGKIGLGGDERLLVREGI